VNTTLSLQPVKSAVEARLPSNLVCAVLHYITALPTAQDPSAMAGPGAAEEEKFPKDQRANGGIDDTGSAQAGELKTDLECGRQNTVKQHDALHATDLFCHYSIHTMIISGLQC
jgi:hypothetical protein